MLEDQWTEVRSGKLLRRLASRDIIAEPTLDQRPTLPSKREWGKGYHYVKPIDGIPMEWDFEGSHYRLIERNNKHYVWRKIKNCPTRKTR